MKFYCGIDLSARDCHVCVIDELKIVVESTFNWYWLIDWSACQTNAFGFWSSRLLAQVTKAA